MKTAEEKTRFFLTPKDKPVSDKWTLIRNVGRDILSPDAQLKLEWIIFYETVAKGNAKQTALHFGVSRKTFHKWLNRFKETNLKTLEEVSRRPLNTRDWMVTKVQERRVISLRKKNMEFGKKKLKRIYIREYREPISTWKIERVIRQYNLFPDKAKHEYQVAKNRKSEPKVRIHQLKDALPLVHKFGFLWHVDAIIIWWYGQRRIIFTALEDKTKIAYARVYTTNTSKYSEDFLKRLLYLSEGRIDITHQDNGSEFKGAFEKACTTLGILQIYSRVRTPTDNAALENFNGTLQREWLAFSKVGLDDIDAANQDLTLWLIKFNSYRPHEALDYQTPLEYAHEQFFKVLPMWPASTTTRLCKLISL